MPSAGLPAVRSARPRAAMARATAGRSCRVALDVDRATEVRLGDLVSACDRGRFAGPLEQVGGLGRIGRHQESLFEETERLVVRTKVDGPRGRSLERDLGLTGERVGLGPLGRIRVRRQVVAGQARRRSRRCPGSRRSARRRGGGACGRAWPACCRRPRGSAPGRRRTGRARGCAGRFRGSAAHGGRARAVAARARPRRSRTRRRVRPA